MFYCAYQAACYLAPEVLRGDDRHITTSADMWSLGAVLTYIANDRKALFRSKEDVFNWRGDKSPMEREFKYPELHKLILSLLSVDKHSRPTARQVYKNHCCPEKQSSRPNSPQLWQTAANQIFFIFDKKIEYYLILYLFTIFISSIAKYTEYMLCIMYILANVLSNSIGL